MDSESLGGNFRQLSTISRLKLFSVFLFVITSLLCYGILNVYESHSLASHNPKSGEKIRPSRCQLNLNIRNKSIPSVERPPWFDHMNNSSATNKSASSVEDRVFYLTSWMDGKLRLGNHLFRYASLFGIAWRNAKRIPLWNFNGFGFRTMFHRLRIPEDHESPYRQDAFTTIREGDAFPFKYIDAVEKLPPSNIHLYAFLIDERYFAHVEDQLRYDLTFSADTLKEARSKLDAYNASLIQGGAYSRVIMHVRRTDMTRIVDSFLVHHLADYLNRAMNHFTECLPRVHFIVASDDISWCRQNINLRDNRHRVDFIEGDRSPGVDLAIASLCDHAIITFGTYSWWIAWFANGVTRVPSQDTVKDRRPPVSARAVTLSLKWTIS